MAKTTKKTTKRRKPKGKLVSERLAERERPQPSHDEDADEDIVDAAFEDAPPSADDPDEVDEDELADEPSADEDDFDDEPSAGGEDDAAAIGDEVDDEELAAGQLGHQRYVVAGFFGLWLIVGYILGRAFEGMWAEAASRTWFLKHIPQLAAVEDEGALISRASISLVAGLLVGAAITLRYYYNPEVRTWADEVAEQLNKVKWPTRKEVGNNTVVVIVASAVITLYLTLLDRFWGFLTNLIYVGGA